MYDTAGLGISCQSPVHLSQSLFPTSRALLCLFQGLEVLGTSALKEEGPLGFSAEFGKQLAKYLGDELGAESR